LFLFIYMDNSSSSITSTTGKQAGFSFKLQSKPSNIKRKEPSENDEKRDYVVSITGTQIESLVPEEKKGPLVIPLPETLSTAPVKIHKKYLKLVNGLNTMASDSDSSQMDVEQPTQSQPQQQEPTSTPAVAPVPAPAPAQTEDEEAAQALLKEAEAIARGDYVDAPVGTDLPLLLKFRNTELDKIDDEEKRFKADVASRPDEADLDGYERVPIDQFGTAMLRGMGWSEGAPIGVGDNAKVVPVTEFVSRPGYRTGLGATPLAAPPPKKKKIIKPGESREPKVLLTTLAYRNFKNNRLL
jgi:hypothetical protein